MTWVVVKKSEKVFGGYDVLEEHDDFLRALSRADALDPVYTDDVTVLSESDLRELRWASVGVH